MTTSSPDTVLAPFTEQEILSANVVKANVENLISTIEKSAKALNESYVSLGAALVTVSDKKLWMVWGLKSFGEYLETVGPRINYSRSQMYNIIGIAEKLLPVVSEENLVKMGVTKAGMLAKAVKNTGEPPTEELVSKAVDPKTKADEFEEEVAHAFHMVEPNSKGKFYSLGFVMLEDDEKTEFMNAVQIAIKMGAEVKHPVEKWTDLTPTEKKIVLQKWIMEYVGTYGGKNADA